MSQHQSLSTETIKQFVTAAHADLEEVQALLAEHPDLLNVEYDWGPGGGPEDALGAASHMGNREIAEYLLARGAPLTICAAAMLGRREQVEDFVRDENGLANARGAHGIPVMFHAAMSGEVPIAEVLKAYGCNEGYGHALHGAINFGRVDMVAWLLGQSGIDVGVPDFRAQTPLERALETRQAEIAELLRQHEARHPTDAKAGV